MRTTDGIFISITLGAATDTRFLRLTSYKGKWKSEKVKNGKRKSLAAFDRKLFTFHFPLFTLLANISETFRNSQYPCAVGANPQKTAVFDFLLPFIILYGRLWISVKSILEHKCGAVLTCRRDYLRFGGRRGRARLAD